MFDRRAYALRSGLLYGILALAAHFCSTGWAQSGGKIMMYADSSSGRPFSKDPAVVRFGGRYLLYHSFRVEKSWGIGVAGSRNLIDWTQIDRILPAADYEATVIRPVPSLLDSYRVAQNYAEEYFWLNLAARNGDEDYAMARDIVGTELSATALIAAQRRAREWKPRPQNAPVPRED